jgi:hypothetical protein
MVVRKSYRQGDEFDDSDKDDDDEMIFKDAPAKDAPIKPGGPGRSKLAVEGTLENFSMWFYSEATCAIAPNHLRTAVAAWLQANGKPAPGLPGNKPAPTKPPPGKPTPAQPTPAKPAPER